MHTNAHERAGEVDMRVHDSRYYGKRYMMRLDPLTWEKLEHFSEHFDTSAGI
jgi:hypothetical protein